MHVKIYCFQIVYNVDQFGIQSENADIDTNSTRLFSRLCYRYNKKDKVYFIMHLEIHKLDSTSSITL